MNTQRFGDFTFDPLALRLYRGRAEVPLRPKTAALLHELLARRDGVVSKRELIEAVWGSEHVADQSLFQAVSELRRALAPLAPIRTVPNKGYCWIEPLRAGVARRWAMGVAATAVVAALLVVAGDSGQRTEDTLPRALSAFASGVDALTSGDPAAAERFFRLSESENPGFAEARLLLAESLLRQGKTGQAHELALQLVEAQRDGHDAYTVVAAMELVSRVAQRDGHSDEALQWALDASKQAADEGLYCVARDLNERLRSLLAAAQRPAAAVARLAGIGQEMAAECERRRRGLEVSETIAPPAGGRQAHAASRRPGAAAV